MDGAEGLVRSKRSGCPAVKRLDAQFQEEAGKEECPHRPGFSFPAKNHPRAGYARAGEPGCPAIKQKLRFKPPEGAGDDCGCQQPKPRRAGPAAFDLIDPPEGGQHEEINDGVLKIPVDEVP